MEFIDSFPTEVKEVINTLSSIDDLEAWNEVRKTVHVELREIHLNYAMYKWIERMITQEKLLLHPNVKQELVSRDYKPLVKHKKMIWASLLATYENKDSKERFDRIKGKIKKHYTSRWWLDVYNIYNQFRIVYLKLKRIDEKNGGGIALLASKSTFIGNAIQEEREKLMRELPTELAPRIPKIS